MVDHYCDFGVYHLESKKVIDCGEIARLRTPSGAWWLCPAHYDKVFKTEEAAIITTFEYSMEGTKFEQ
jgi:hypothetical protein